jgi:hypothetical protein
MAVTDTIRPVSTRKAGAGVAVPSGTLHGVTSDNSDATYIDFNVADRGNNWSLRMASHTPPADHERHRLRGRIRIRSDAGLSATEDIDVGRADDDYIQYSTVPVTTSFTEQIGDWFQDASFGLAEPGALTDLNLGGGWPPDPSPGTVELRTAECYIDIDCRARPSYSAEVRDAAGVNQAGGTITDTNQPTFYFGTVGYDGLTPLDWRLVLNGVIIDNGSGVPPTSVSAGSLADGAYSISFRVRSIIRVSDPFELQQNFVFTVANEVPPPSPPLLEVSESGGGYLLTWTYPGGQAWDNDFAVAEVWRDDCLGSHRIAVVPDALNGSYLDLAVPQLDPQYVQSAVPLVGCALHAEACDITYRVRYQGYVSTFVELPDTIPADLILAWPSTAASIPSGWTRVTALDGRYPRGANTTGTPSATGGNETHSHTTPGHQHLILSHSHGLGGSTGTSNSNTTSARFNGASQSQADQPHSHTRPSSTGTLGAISSLATSPGTDSVSHLPPTREVIWVESDGSQATYPIGVLGFATEDVSGWISDTASSGRYLRGAPAAGNGGASTGGPTHTHTVSAHTHTGRDHDHTIGSTSLSNPLSSTEAGDGSSEPRWLARHTHPMDVGTSNTNQLNSATGGASDARGHEPNNRRLRVLQNTGGGTQTRIIGLYLGDIASLDPLLTLCDGSNGTPDMRGWFARDRGSDSVNSTGGTPTHAHTTPTHNHSMNAHTHATNVLASTNTQFQRPSFGDLGNSPTTGHDHTSGGTAAVSPGIGTSSSGDTNSVDTTPPYREAHFVRLDGIISGGPLPVPELKVSEFASVTVPSFTYSDGLDRLATLDTKLAVVTDRTHAYPRLVADSVPLDGGLHSVATTLAGEDLTLVIGVEGKSAIDALEEVLSADRVYYSPVGGVSGWFAPAGWNVRAPAPGVKVLSVPMVRQDWPPTPEPSDFL